MATIKSIPTDKRKTANRNRQTYIDGTAVRKLQPVQHPGKERREQRHTKPRLHRAARVKEQYLSIGYTIFLAVVSVLALWVCADYLQLQADNTGRSKNIAALEQELADLKTENDDEYNRVTTSIDLEEIRKIAIEELGMVYANADQVVLYDGRSSDYVKQYSKIPDENENTIKSLFGIKSR